MNQLADRGARTREAPACEGGNRRLFPAFGGFMRLAVELLQVDGVVDVQKSAIRERLLENNDRFACFGVAKLFPGEAFDGFGIVAQRVKVHFQLLGSFFLFLNLGVQAQHFFAHPLVLFDQRQVPERDSEEARRQQKEDHHAPQLAPDAQVNVHRRHLYTGRLATEAVNHFANSLRR